ncbi:MAG: hypothetical protein R3C05_11840 [Pirellulaceae bacterium]
MTDREMQTIFRNAIDAFAAQPSNESLRDLQRIGLIDQNGDVLQRDFSDSQAWDAFLAIVATNATDGTAATHYRCRKPAFGKPGLAEIDVPRESVLRYLNEGKRIVTAVVDPSSGALREGSRVHCVQGRFLRTDAKEIADDNLDELPTFHRVNTGV